MKKTNKILLMLMSLSFTSSFISAQQYLDINYPGRKFPLPVTNEVSLYSCESTPEVYSVKIDNISPFPVSNFTATFKLPQGILYKGNFVGASPGSGTVVTSFTDSTVEVTINSINSQTVKTLSFDIVAGCGVYQHGSAGGKFNVLMDADFAVNGISVNRNYTFAPLIVNYPELQMTEVSYKDGSRVFYNLTSPSIDDIIDREIIFKNGGTSRIDTVYFRSDFGKSLNLISYSKGSHTNVSTATLNSYEIKFSSLEFSLIGNGDGFLDPGEQFTFIEKVKIVNCQNTVSNFSVAWGCETDICQIQEVGNRIIFPSSAPRLKVTPTSSSDACYGNGSNKNMKLYLQNFATNTIDSAENILVDIHQGAGGFSSNFLSVIDITSIVVKHRYGSTIPFTIANTNTNSAALCNAYGSNSIGRFQLEISKIYAGQEIEIKWMVRSCVNSTCTNGGLNVYDWGYSVTYENRCDYVFRENINKVGLSSKSIRHNIIPGGGASQVLGNSGLSSFEFAINESYFDIPSVASQDYLKYIIEKPSCLDFVASNSNVYIEKPDGTFLRPANSDISVSGNFITVKFHSGFYNIGLSKLAVKLSPNCTGCIPSPIENISVSSFYIPSNCATSDIQLGCANLSVSIICDDGCGEDFKILAFNNNSKFIRANYSVGLKDDNDDGTPDLNVSANLNNIQLHRASYNDVVEFQVRVNPGNKTNSNKLLGKNYLYFYAKIDNGALLTFDSLKIDVGGFNFTPFGGFVQVGGVGLQGPTTVIRRAIPGTDSVEYILGVDLNALRLLANWPQVYAVITFHPYFHVNKNLGVSVTPCGADFAVFPDTNLFTATTSIHSKRKKFCFMVKDKLDVLGYDYISSGRSNYRIGECGNITVNETFKFALGSTYGGNIASNYYENEYRNFSYLDTLKIRTNGPYNLVSAQINFTRTTGILSSTTSSYVNITPISSVGNNYVFDLEPLFRSPFNTGSSNPFVFPDEAYASSLKLVLEPNCHSVDGLDTIQYEWKAKTDWMKPRLANSNTLPIAKGMDQLEYIAPEPTIQPTVQLVRVQGKQVVWDVLVTNNSVSSAKNIWFGFNNPITSITVKNVERIYSSPNFMTVPNSIPYGTVNPSSGGIYRLNNLYGGKDFKFRITAEIDPGNCSLDSLVFALGYDCSGYPSSITTTTCGLIELPLYAQPMLPNLFNKITTTEDTVDLCDIITYTLKVENTDIGIAYDVKANIYLQQHLNFISGSAQIYSKTLGYWKSITPTIGSSGQFVFDVNAALPHIAADGLIGLVDTSKNYVLIRFKANTECNYTSGSRIEVSSLANGACGYLNESASSYSNPLHIVGATPTHRNMVILESDFLSPCLDSTDVNLKVVNEGPVNSWVGDSVTIVLPRGIHYAPGTFNSIQNFSTTAPSIVNYLGKEYVTWKLNNLVALTDTAELSIKILSDPSFVSGCDANYLYAYSTTQDNVVCSSTGTACNVKIISGDTSEAIFTYKATATLLNASANSIPNAPSGEKVFVSFDINNQGQSIRKLLNGKNNGTIVSIYRDHDNSGGFSFPDVLLFNDTSYVDIPQGITNFTDTFDIPAGDACNFIVVVDFDLNNCFCNTSEIFVSTVNLNYNESDDTVCVNNSEQIGYLDSISGYRYTWRAGNRASLSYLSSSTAAAPIITAPSIVGNIDSIEYFISIDRLDCTSEDTVMIYILNNPVSLAGNDTSVCFDSTKLNGNSILLAGGKPITSYWIVDSTFGNGFTGVNIVNPSDPKSSVNGLIEGEYKFIWTLDNGLCEPSTDTVKVTVLNPVFSAGADTSICASDSVLINGSISTAGFTPNWTILSSPPSGAIFTNPNLIKPTIKNLANGTYELQMKISSSGCDYFDTTELIVTVVPSVNAGVDSSFCGTNSFNLWADSIKSATVSGSWSVDSSLGNHGNVSFADSSLYNTSVIFNASDTFKLVWSSSHTFCANISDTVEIIISALINIDAGEDTVICNTDSIDLYAKALMGDENGEWKQISGPSTSLIGDSSDNTSPLSNLIPGIYLMEWNVTNGICDTISDTVKITIETTSIANAGIDDTICLGTGTYNMTATSVSGQDTGVWKQVSGPSTALFGKRDSATTGISGLVVGSYEFEWTVGNGVCDSVKDSVEIIVLPSSLADAGMNDSLCINDTANYQLDALPLTGSDVGVWEQASGTSTGIVNPSIDSTRITGLSVGTFDYVWVVTNGACDTIRDTVRITVFGNLTANAGIDDTICLGTGTYNMTATSVSGQDTGVWKQVSGPSTALFGKRDSATTGISGLVVGSYEFEWTVGNGVCDSVKDSVEIIVLPSSLADAGMNDSLCINDTANYQLDALPLTGSDVGVWEQASGTSTGIVNPSIDSTRITGLSVGTFDYVWVVTNGACDTIRDTVRITVFGNLTANAGIDDTICLGTGTYNMTATSVSGQDTGVWKQVSGPSTALFGKRDSATTGISGLVVGSYEFEWTVGNGVCDSVKDSVEIIVLPSSLADAGMNDSLCINDTANYQLDALPLTGSDVGVWEQASGTSTGIVNPSIDSTRITGLSVGTFDYVWVVTNGACDTIRDTVRITVFGNLTANAGIDDTICLGTGTYNMTATSVSGQDTGVWKQVSGPSTALFGKRDSATTGISGLVVGSYEFEWTVGNGVCDSVKDSVEIIVLPSSLADAGMNDSLCINDTANYQLDALPLTGSDVGVWEQASGTSTGIVNPSIDSTRITGLSVGTFDYVWVVTNGACDTIRDTVRITVFGNLTANAGIDDTICLGTGTYNMTATSVSGQDTGVWKQVSGPSTALFGKRDSATTGISGLVVGSYEFEWTVGNGVCDSVKDSVEIIVLPSSLADAGMNDSLCINDTANYQLDALPLTGSDVGVWEQASGTSTGIVNPSIDSTRITGLSVGTFDYVWVVTNGACDTIRDTVRITVFGNLTANAGIDDTICLGTGTYNMTATSVSGQDTGVWKQVSGPSTALFGKRDSATTGISGLVVGSYEFEWTVGNGVCDSVKDSVEIIVLPSSLADAGMNDSLCINDTANYQLDALPLTGSDVGVWEQASGTSTGIVNPSIDSTRITGLSVGTFDYVWVVTNGACDTIRDTVRITVFGNLTANAGIDDTICLGTGTYNMTATSVSGQDTGVWKQVSGPSTALFGKRDSATTGISGLVVGSYEFEWIVGNGVCDTVRDTVLIEVYGTVSSIAGFDDTICITDTAGYRMAANSIFSPDKGVWNKISGPSIQVDDYSSNNTLIKNLSIGTYELEWLVTNSLCDTVRDTVSITLLPKPISIAGPNISSCTIDTMNLAGNIPTALEKGTWTQVDGNPAVTFGNINSHNSYVTNLSYGVYKLVWTVSNGFCLPATDTMTIIIDSLSNTFAGNDDSICQSTRYIMNADPVSGSDVGTWTQIDGNPSVSFSNMNDPNAIISKLSPNDYMFVWTVTSNVCPSVSDTVNISVVEASVAQAGADQTYCEESIANLSSTYIHNKTYHNYNWSFYAAGSSVSSAPVIVSPNAPSTAVSGLEAGIYAFVLEVSNSVCPPSYDTIVLTLMAKPEVDFTVADQGLCFGDCHSFTNLTTISDPSGSVISKYIWKTGDGNLFDSTDLTYCYSTIDSYDVSLVAVSNFGCVDTMVKTGYVSLNPIPVAGFKVGPEEITPNAQVIITDESVGATVYRYNFGNGDERFISEPVYNYSTIGLYTIWQFVENQYGCVDSTSRSVEVRFGMRVFIPNAFTPDEDGVNDVFLPKMTGVDEKGYNLMIFNRWGEIIFQTTDPSEGWDGRHKGIKSPQGIYVWKITYKEANGFDIQKKEGYILSTW